MEIIYKQTSPDVLLDSLGIQNCYLKHLCSNNDSKTTFCRTHHHAGVEIHFVNKGHQTYIIDGKEFVVSEGHILFIPPLVKHFVADTQFYESKFSITFNNCCSSPFHDLENFTFIKADERTVNNMEKTLNERKSSSVFSRQIISNCIYESLVFLLRSYGFNEKYKPIEGVFEDDRLFMAKNYIRDNIEFNITVSDVAAYCCISTKQLTRLFKQYEDTTPLCYIQKQRIKHIESLLQSGASLKSVSETMNFSNEYHFNSFYKKYAGISPGVYKKMHTQ